MCFRLCAFSEVGDDLLSRFGSMTTAIPWLDPRLWYQFLEGERDIEEEARDCGSGGAPFGRLWP